MRITHPLIRRSSLRRRTLQQATHAPCREKNLHFGSTAGTMASLADGTTLIIFPCTIVMQDGEQYLNPRTNAMRMRAIGYVRRRPRQPVIFSHNIFSSRGDRPYCKLLRSVGSRLLSPAAASLQKANFYRCRSPHVDRDWFCQAKRLSGAQIVPHVGQT